MYFELLLSIQVLVLSIIGVAFVSVAFVQGYFTQTEYLYWSSCVISFLLQTGFPTTDNTKYSNCMMRRGSTVIAIGAAVAAGMIATRQILGPTRRLNRLMNGNLRLFPSEKDRNALHRLALGNRRYLLSGWPRPGVSDAAKRELVQVADTGDGMDVELARLSVLERPNAIERPHVIEHHGDKRTDEFYWLRDDERTNKEVIAYLNEENKYTKAVLADTEALQEELYREMRGRIQEADQSTPQRHKGYWYYSRTEEGQQYKVHCRRKVVGIHESSKESETDEIDESVVEEILLDENKDSKGHAFYMVGGLDESPNNKLLAYAVDTKGNESYTLYVKDLETGEQLLKRPIPDTAGSFAWALDNKTLFYVTKDALDRPYKVNIAFHSS